MWIVQKRVQLNLKKEFLPNVLCTQVTSLLTSLYILPNKSAWRGRTWCHSGRGRAEQYDLNNAGIWHSEQAWHSSESDGSTEEKPQGCMSKSLLISGNLSDFSRVKSWVCPIQTAWSSGHSSVKAKASRPAESWGSHTLIQTASPPPPLPAELREARLNKQNSQAGLDDSGC